MYSENIELTKEMTLEEKASLCSGKGFWTTKPVTRLGIDSVMVSDGPHGIRKQLGDCDHLGMSESVKAVCFPTGSALGASFDVELLEEVGACLGEAAAAEGLHTLLGPAVNIKRSPLGGRNFEYYSEDPFLTGELGSAYVQGIQSKQTGACVKHFAANNQEQDRMSIDVQVSERALREIYLRGFERIVRKAKPWSLMCAYNRINGHYCCENPWLLEEVLRKEWGFDGIVITDWGAMNNRCQALSAGLELEMPACGGQTDRQIVQAVQDGSLPEETLDIAVARLLNWLQKGRACQPAREYDLERQHQVARRAAGECAVLLKNNGVLPLPKGSCPVFIGGFAEFPRYQGGGSSHINSVQVPDVLTVARTLADVQYVRGFSADGNPLPCTAIQEAVNAASQARFAVVFAGLPDSWESEGYDRTGLELPSEQNALISAVAAVQPNTVVVLHNGSPVTMPWLSDVAAILEMHLGGEAVAEATADILFGDVNPSGKLAETYPMQIQDTPAWLNFPGNGKTVHYGEDIYVGYRWYDGRQMDVLFPFGYGLSYTNFAYTSLTLDKTVISDGETLTASISIRNTGNRTGKEIIQLYVHAEKDTGAVGRPLRQLCGFSKIELQPGEEKTVRISLDPGCFAYYEERMDQWYTSSGTYILLAGPNSREFPLQARLRIQSRQKLPLTVEDATTVADVLTLGSPEQVALLEALLKKTSFGGPSEAEENRLGSGTRQMLESMRNSLPLHTLRSFGNIDSADLEQLLTILQAEK